MTKKFETMLKELIYSVGASRWKRQAAIDLEKRDVCDVLKDLAHLTAIFQQKFSELTNKENE
jgi:hypothetical protein